MLIEKNNLISEESAVANNMINQCFTQYVLLSKQVNLKKSDQLKNLEDTIKYYDNHISI